MATGLIALLDDVAALAKVAAASLDDTVTQAAQAGVKATGLVIDDAAVAPRYVMGFTADRELPIVGRIALGSLKNKLIFLLPAALLLSLLAAWAITPLLMLGGLYLSYEGAEKIWHALHPVAEQAPAQAASGGRSLEDRKVRGAVQTDFILSAEIMAMTLATVPDEGFWVQAAVLALVGVFMTALVYGGVALIVRADDIGVALARSTGGLQALWRPLGRGLVRGVPYFLRALALVGTAAMVWVGGGILIHGLESFAWLGWGLEAPGHVMEAASHEAAAALPGLAGLAAWTAGAVVSGIVGLLAGVVLLAGERLVTPLWRARPA